MRKGRIVRAFEWFFELPVAVMLVVFCALVLYLCWLLLRAVVGA